MRVSFYILRIDSRDLVETWYASGRNNTSQTKSHHRATPSPIANPDIHWYITSAHISDLVSCGVYEIPGKTLILSDPTLTPRSRHPHITIPTTRLNISSRGY
ncbi:hypothetical protein HBI56_135970 [Parastagonospora nodorum]|nr:hypothetical protein HBH56_039060 [Parastagonospora nodorum]KAH3940994.1 hypothetical protein HBH53_207880 [Parastagonospora nodorum]KAH3959661.1 hypothetical protein HBH52_241680 [Parastagonospora nodorum]KAH4032169.1 hypothetical protein HBI13_020980 [Parastagonospora nodorum]KAH4098210.1 hypothetical protein HBH48_029900 [Parastagonospora nodorum]